MRAPRYYVGVSLTARTVFVSDTVPTWRTHHPRFLSVIGPFETEAGAAFMATYGAGNPHCRTVDEAERLAAFVATHGVQARRGAS